MVQSFLTGRLRLPPQALRVYVQLSYSHHDFFGRFYRL